MRSFSPTEIPSKSSSGFSVWPMAAITMSAGRVKSFSPLRNRFTAARAVEVAQLHRCGTSTRNDISALSDELQRRGEELELHALALGLLDLFFVGRHFGPGAPIDHRRGCRAEAQGGARSVHSGVPAADDDDIAARPLPSR